MRMNILSKNRTLILLEDDLLDLEHLERQVVKVCQKNSINSLNVISFSQTPLALEALKRTPDVALLICDTFRIESQPHFWATFTLVLAS